jgi:hypothetical protein
MCVDVNGCVWMYMDLSEYVWMCMCVWMKKEKEKEEYKEEPLRGWVQGFV